MSGERPSDHFPSTLVSWGADAEHALEISSDSPLSSYHSSQAPDIPDMGSVCRGGKMSTAKGTAEFEDASPAVLARACYLNVVPARDTKSITPERESSEMSRSLTILQKFTITPLTDGTVFNYEAMALAHKEVEATLMGVTDELNSVCKGFSHYFLKDDIELIDDPSVPIEAKHLRRMADVVAAVLSGWLQTTKEGESDVWASLLPGDWYRLATFIMVAIARGCVRLPDVGCKGNFDVEPCKDNFLHDASLIRPCTQRELLSAVSAQVQEELKKEGVLLPQDSVDGLRATIWRAHEGQIRAWTEKEVLSVYNCLSNICLSDILDKIKAEASIDEIMDVMREEMAMETRGKFLGLIAQEKTKAYEAALEEAQADGLKQARAQGEAEAAQKGCSYANLQLDRAKEEACLEAVHIFKNKLQSARDKMMHQVEVEIGKERDNVIAKRCTALEVGLASMDFDARVEHVRSLVVQYGLLDETSKGGAAKPKLPTPPPKSLTTPLADLRLPDRNAEREFTRFLEVAGASKSTVEPPSEPSPCLTAGEDETTPKATPVCMDWSEGNLSDTLPIIDFDVDTRSIKASIHFPENAMEDDAPRAVGTFCNTDHGTIPLSPSVSLPAPKSEVAQLFDLIMAKIAPIESELIR
jgi:hypothetical protein